jgi:hypothetical protein
MTRHTNSNADPVAALVAKLGVPASEVEDSSEEAEQQQHPQSPQRPPKVILSKAELAQWMPRRPDKPLTGAARHVYEYVVSWLATTPMDSILPFRTLEAALAIPSGKLRSLRWNHSGLTRALVALNLEEVATANGRAVGWRRRTNDSA